VELYRNKKVLDLQPPWKGISSMIEAEIKKKFFILFRDLKALDLHPL